MITSVIKCAGVDVGGRAGCGCGWGWVGVGGVGWWLGEISYPFPNNNDVIVEAWKWISDFVPHFTEHVITYPCCDQS